MRVRLTNPITGKSRTQASHLTTNHNASSYGLPVLIVGGEVLDYTNVVLQGMQIVEPPKRADQVRMLEQWTRNLSAMLGAEIAR